MRFYEYEAREIVRRAGIPVTAYGLARDPAEAAQIAQRIGGPVVVKSQVLSGGRRPSATPARSSRSRSTASARAA
jgi:succinyl-CoA synthetase beta subunit